MGTICGIDCSTCFNKDNCKGCTATEGHPLGGECVAIHCCQAKGKTLCSECCTGTCEQKTRVINEVNALGIKDMPEVTEMYELAGCIINIDYALPSDEKAKFWKDKNIYWGVQVKKLGSERFYGVAADEKYLMVSEYGENGIDPEIIMFKKR